MTTPDAAALIKRAEQFAITVESSLPTVREGLGTRIIRELVALLTARETAPEPVSDWYRAQRERVTALEAALATAQDEAQENWQSVKRLTKERDALRDQLATAPMALQRDGLIRERDALRDQVAEWKRRYDATLAMDATDAEQAHAALVSQLRSLIQQWRASAARATLSPAHVKTLKASADQVEALLPPDAPQQPTETEWNRIRWIADHYDRHGTLTKREQFIECACGATYWPPDAPQETKP